MKPEYFRIWTDEPFDKKPDWLKLGLKVRCSAYMRKTGYSLSQDQHDRNIYYIMLDGQPVKAADTDLGDYASVAVTRKGEKADFVGYVCGIKTLNTEIGFVYEDGDYGSGLIVVPTRRQRCLEVCCENKNGSYGKRYVPFDSAEICE